MMQLPPDVRIRRSKILPTLGGWLSGRRGPMSAVTIRHTITVHPDRPLTNRLLRHELAHVQQWHQHPWTFPLRYAWNHLRHGHRNNPYEVEARGQENDLGLCPYFARSAGHPGHDPEGVCFQMGFCIAAEEPLCVKNRPSEGWPSEQGNR